jgi:shikimate kinase/shikimate kinase/3-dehydroquinate synthase
MKSKENLVFLGMMGSGKSSIGSLTAKKLEIKFIDVDKEIEKNWAYLYPKYLKQKVKIILENLKKK